jgi:hypothetical protein
MGSNAPAFDPINPVGDEQAEMVAGFTAAYAGAEKPAITSVAWDHGYRMGRSDLTGIVDDDQRILAKRHVAKSRGLPDPFPPSHSAS